MLEIKQGERVSKLGLGAEHAYRKKGVKIAKIGGKGYSSNPYNQNSNHAIIRGKVR